MHALTCGLGRSMNTSNAWRLMAARAQWLPLRLECGDQGM
jgi:hypothetical protein